MNDEDSALRQHWDDRYRSTADTEVSWYEPEASTSLALIDTVVANAPRSIIDIGAGTSRLVDALLDRGDQVTTLDISQVALDQVRARHDAVDTVCADIRTWRPERRWDLWHDRAVLHFFTEAEDRQRYADALRQAVGPTGAFVLGVFAIDGPEHCSGLPVHRFSSSDLRGLLGDVEVVDERRTVHRTPAGVDQRFQWIAGRLR